MIEKLKNLPQHYLISLSNNELTVFKAIGLPFLIKLDKEIFKVESPYESLIKKFENFAGKIEFENLTDVINAIETFEKNLIPDRIVISGLAHFAIILDSKLNHGTETGGFLFGKINDDLSQVEISIATSTGKGVRKNPVAVTTSQIYFRKIYPQLKKRGLHYIGEWHKHINLDKLSGIDLKTIRNILTGNEAKVLQIQNIFIALLAVVDSDEKDIKIKGFCAKLTDENNIIVKEIPVEITEKAKKTNEIKVVLIDEPEDFFHGYFYPNENVLVLSDNAPIIDDIAVDKFSIEIQKTEEFYIRHKGLINDKIIQKKILIIGAGSVGSRIALNLAPIVGEIHIVDFDKLDIHNPVRWGIPIDIQKDIGRFKANVLAEYLSKSFPGRKFCPYQIDVIGEFNKLKKIVREIKPDLIICSTDSHISRSRVNALSIAMKIPSFFITLSEAARSGQILFFVPGETSCYNCFVEQSSLKNLTADGNIYGTREGVPALNINIDFICGFASRVILDFLTNDLKSFRKIYLPEENLNDYEWNVLWISAEKGWIFTKTSQFLPATYEANPNCPCSINKKNEIQSP